MESIQKKYAVIINPDTETRHLKNVEDSLNALEEQGYETIVYSTQKPSSKYDEYYAEKDSSAFFKRLDQLSYTITNQDEIVIYTTGHGSKSYKNTSYCIGENCSTNSIFEYLSFQAAKQKVVIMDQCYSGNFAKLFSRQENTLFISPGRENETVTCDSFSPFFWDTNAKDINNDKEIGWQERFQYASQIGNNINEPQYIATKGFKDKGSEKLSGDILEIESDQAFEKQLEILQAGQFAVVDFGATWCKPCKDYRPHFQEFAEQAPNNYQFISTNNTDIAKKFNIDSYPTIAVFDHKKRMFLIHDRNNLIKELGLFQIPIDEIISDFNSKLENITDSYSFTEASIFLERIVFTRLELENKNDLKIELFESLIKKLEPNYFSHNRYLFNPLAHLFKTSYTTLSSKQKLQKVDQLNQKLNSKNQNTKFQAFFELSLFTMIFHKKISFINTKLNINLQKKLLKQSLKIKMPHELLDKLSDTIFSGGTKISSYFESLCKKTSEENNMQAFYFLALNTAQLNRDQLRKLIKISKAITHKNNLSNHNTEKFYLSLSLLFLNIEEIYPMMVLRTQLIIKSLLKDLTKSDTLLFLNSLTTVMYKVSLYQLYKRYHFIKSIDKFLSQRDDFQQLKQTYEYYDFRIKYLKIHDSKNEEKLSEIKKELLTNPDQKIQSLARLISKD